MPLYRELTSQAEVDAEYDAGAAVAGSAAIVRGWAARSEAARGSMPCRLGLPYGPTREEYLDLFRAAPGAPLHLFVHGGYWRRFSARDFSFVAPPLVAAGLSVAVINYALCPSVTIDEIVRQIRAAVAWSFTNAEELGVDPSRLTVSGHSAGGHLAAMIATTDWPGRYALPADTVKGILAVSGLFDLAPFPWSWLQPSLQLSTDQVLRNSPVGLAPGCAVELAVGAGESAEFRRQSRELAERWRVPCREIDGRDHFTVVEEIEEPGSRLVETILGLTRNGTA